MTDTPELPKLPQSGYYLWEHPKHPSLVARPEDADFAKGEPLWVRCYPVEVFDAVVGEPMRKLPENAREWTDAESAAFRQGWSFGRKEGIRATPAVSRAEGLEAAFTQALEERDTYHEWADKLAEQIASHLNVEIGEHSSDNNPWENAVDYLSSTPDIGSFMALGYPRTAPVAPAAPAEPSEGEQRKSFEARARKSGYMLRRDGDEYVHSASQHAWQGWMMGAEMISDRAGVASLVAGEVPKEIAAIIENLHTQDNRITENPLFAVQQKRQICGLDDGYEESWVWVNGDSEEITDEDEIATLNAAFDRGEDTPGDRRVGVAERWEFVTGCLTEQGCKDYIASNGHNLREPRIYAYGSYRNAEFIAIRKWLMSLRASAGEAQS